MASLPSHPRQIWPILALYVSYILPAIRETRALLATCTHLLIVRTSRLFAVIKTRTHPCFFIRHTRPVRPGGKGTGEGRVGTGVMLCQWKKFARQQRVTKIKVHVLVGSAFSLPDCSSSSSSRVCIVHCFAQPLRVDCFRTLFFATDQVKKDLNLSFLRQTTIRATWRVVRASGLRWKKSE